MRRLEVVYTETSATDLDAIHRSLLTLGAYPSVADNYVRRIIARCDKIGDAPYGGRSRDDLRAGLRMIGFERRLVILYRVVGDLVEIDHIFYGGQDYETRLRSEAE
jgi:toxin ParE1/3/4